jgi:predicted acyltransferase
MTILRRRLASIDAFRAITMLLMIFVNDLILDERVPAWLEHAEEGQDRLGLADTVFPAFLFIVGLSIPLAIRFGHEKGMSRKSTFLHILRRGVALLIMGVFIVNYEEYTKGPALISVWWWMLLMTIAFFFVWLVYPASWSVGRKTLFRVWGISALVVLALIYKGGTAEHPTWMKTHWYGILGLIGWVYLVCALLYFYIGDRLLVLGVCFLFFLAMSIAWNMSSLKATMHSLPHFWFLDSGGLCAFAMAGIMVTVYYRRATGSARVMQNLFRLAVWAPFLLAAGFALRPIGGIAKLGVTPSWILICTAISIAAFVLLAVVVDIRGRENWYRLIKPAGTITLTCYLLPYIHFALLHILGEQARLPLWMRTGGIGVLKSLVFAFLIVLLTGVLERKKIRLSV